MGSVAIFVSFCQTALVNATVSFDMFVSGTPLPDGTQFQGYYPPNFSQVTPVVGVPPSNMSQPISMTILATGQTTKFGLFLGIFSPWQGSIIFDNIKITP